MVTMVRLSVPDAPPKPELHFSEGSNPNSTANQSSPPADWHQLCRPPSTLEAPFSHSSEPPHPQPCEPTEDDGDSPSAGSNLSPLASPPRPEPGADEERSTCIPAAAGLAVHACMLLECVLMMQGGLRVCAVCEHPKRKLLIDR